MEFQLRKYGVAEMQLSHMTLASAPQSNYPPIINSVVYEKRVFSQFEGELKCMGDRGCGNIGV